MPKVTLHQVGNANPKQEKLVRTAARLLDRAVNDPAFRNSVLKAPYKETRFRDRRGNISHKKPQDILDTILGGIERDTRPDNELDLSLNLAKIARPTIGSAIPGKLPWRTAYWFIDECVERGDTITPARHLIHEWLHVAGFVHVKNDGRRPDVPYLVGDVVRTILRTPGLDPEATEDEEMARVFEAAEDQVLDEDETADEQEQQDGPTRSY
jgi:hypothetical protein